MKQRSYIAIDLKSFYASVECRERGLDPLDTNLVVADESRTDKTICLAVTPSLKAYGISGRARLFEVVQRVKEANRGRLYDAPGQRFSGKSCFFSIKCHTEAGDWLSNCTTAYGLLYGIQHTHLQYLSEVHYSRG